MKPWPALLFLFPLSLGALDGGVTVQQTPQVTWGATNQTFGTFEAQAWWSQSWPGIRLRVAADGSGTLVWSGATWSWENPTLDLGELRLDGSLPGDPGTGLFEWSAGRRKVSDLTGGFILDSRWDGAGFAWYKGPNSIWASMGSTALLLKTRNPARGSPADWVDLNRPEVVWAPPRGYFLAGLGVRELFLRQDAGLEVIGDRDFRSEGAVHGAYSTLKISGPFLWGGRQRLFGTLSLRIAQEQTGAFLVGTDWALPLPWGNSELLLSSRAAQGAGGFGFRSLSDHAISDVGLPVAKAAVGSLEYTLNPVRHAVLAAKTSLLFWTSQDPVSLAGFDPGASASWLGTEAGLTGSWAVSSELSLGFRGGAFFPQPEVFYPSTKPTAWAGLTAVWTM